MVLPAAKGADVGQWCVRLQARSELPNGTWRGMPCILRIHVFQFSYRATMTRLFLFALATGLVGCGSDITPVCATVLLPAFEITVVDSASSRMLNGTNTVIAITNGSAPETMTWSQNPVYVYGDPGTYNLIVRVAGYGDWSKATINVATGSDGCHPVRVELIAKLQAIR